MAERVRPRLVQRVAWISALAVAIGSAAAAVLSAVVADGLVENHENDTVHALAVELASEVTEEMQGGPDGIDDDDDDIELDAQGRPVLSSVLVHELRDVKRPLASAAIIDADETIAGDRTLPYVGAGECTLQPGREHTLRVCGALLEDGSLVLLGVGADAERQRRMLVGWALLAGVVMSACVGGALSYRSAVWALQPVTDLQRRVCEVDADAPSAAGLEPPAHHEEVEALRLAVARLVCRLGESLTAAQAFSAHAAHELRTPLAVLCGELELLLENAAPGSQDYAALSRSHRIARSLVDLTQRLLVLAGSKRPMREQGEPIDLTDVVEAVRLELAPADARRVRIRVEDDSVVQGDFDLLRSMVHNAIENALKFSADEVDVQVLRGEAIVLSVVDRGPGIAPEEREQVFAPFHRGGPDLAALTTGHGIGLALISHVAQAHGGAARFVDADEGAHLEIRLPPWGRGSISHSPDARGA